MQTAFGTNWPPRPPELTPVVHAVESTAPTHAASPPTPIAQQLPGLAVVVQSPLTESQTLPGGPRVPAMKLPKMTTPQPLASGTQMQMAGLPPILQHATVVLVVDEVVVVVVVGAFWQVNLPGP